MKEKLFTLIAVLLAGAIAYGGSGVNVYFFCCNDCRTEGISAVAEHKCCEIHRHHHLGGIITHTDEHQCHQEVSEKHDACGVDRIFFNWPSPTKNQSHLQPFFLYLDHSVFSSISGASLHISDKPVESPFTTRRTQKPPDLGKDVYLDLLTTLII